MTSPVCIGCGREWRRDEEVSPGEADELCRACFDMEDPDPKDAA